MRFADALEANWKAQVERAPWLKRLEGWAARLRARAVPRQRAGQCAGARGPLAGLHLEDRLFLGPKRMLAVVSYRGEEFLIAAGAETIASVLPLGAARRAEPSEAREPSELQPESQAESQRMAKAVYRPTRRAAKPGPKTASQAGPNIASKAGAEALPQQARSGGREAAPGRRRPAANHAVAQAALAPIASAPGRLQ